MTVLYSKLFLQVSFPHVQLGPEYVREVEVVPSILTLCRTDRLLIKYPQFLDVLNTLHVQPHNIFLLMV